ncbi:MAG: histidine kinase, partial [Pseudomonadota bacterium]
MGPKSLAFRLFVSAAAWVLVVIPIAAILLTSLYRQSIERNFDARLDVYMTSLIAASTAEGGDEPESPESLGAPLFDIPFSGWYWQIKTLDSIDGDDRPLFASDSLLDQQLELPSSGDAPPDDTLTRRSYVTGPDDENLRIEEREIRPGGQEEPAYSYAVAGNSAEIDEDLAQFTTMLVLALVVLGVGLTAATFFQVRFGLLPLRAIRHDLAAIRSGDAEKLEGELPDEIKPLQSELNALIQSNRDVVERARTHVGNLAHALKTPLSV